MAGILLGGYRHNLDMMGAAAPFGVLALLVASEGSLFDWLAGIMGVASGTPAYALTLVKQDPGDAVWWTALALLIGLLAQAIPLHRQERAHEAALRAAATTSASASATPPGWGTGIVP